MEKEKQMVIYKITNTTNGKYYIGSAINYETRIKRHLNDLKVGRHHSSKLQRSYNKYGQESFIFEVIEIITSLEKLIESEQKWLDELKPYFNMTLIAGLNSHLGMKRSQITKDKIRDKLTGIIRSQETKNKISEAKLGIKINSEALINMNKDKIGKSLTKQHKDRIAKGNEGKVVSQKTKDLISTSLKDQNLVSAVSISVKKYSLDGELLEEYSSMKKAEISNGYSRDSLRYHLVVKNKIEHNGFKWYIVKTKYYN